MKIGIATCIDKPNLTDGDRLLVSCLEQKGIKTRTFIWNQTNTSDLNCDAVVVRSTWDYHQNSERFLNWISELEHSKIKLTNSAPVIRWNINKSYLLDLETQGVVIVPSLLLKKEFSVSQISELIRQKNWPDLILKPTISATAYLTFHISANDPELPRKIEQLKNHSDFLVQPYISSITSSGELSLVFFNSDAPRFSHAVLKRPKSGDFRVQSDFGGSYQLLQPSKQLVDFAQNCIQKIKGGWSYARVDLVDWEHEPLVGELELIEPDLYLTHHPAAAQTLADAVIKSLDR